MMPGDPHNLIGVCWCIQHYAALSKAFDSSISLHKRIEQRIIKLEQPVLGLKGGVSRQEVLKIIEEEFGKLDHI